jgi:hypothetical protein
MTAAASDDWIDRVGGRRIRRTDELEHWLTDLHVTLNETDSWLTPEDNLDDVAPTPLPEPRPTTGHESRTTAWPTDPEGSLASWPTGVYAGRHRAAD